MPEHTLKCRTCGYVLHGIESDGACPECATSVIETIQRRTYWRLSDRDRMRIRHGYLLLGFALTLEFTCFVLAFIAFELDRNSVAPDMPEWWYVYGRRGLVMWIDAAILVGVGLITLWGQRSHERASFYLRTRRTLLGTLIAYAVLRLAMQVVLTYHLYFVVEQNVVLARSEPLHDALWVHVYVWLRDVLRPACFLVAGIFALRLLRDEGARRRAKCGWYGILLLTGLSVLLLLMDVQWIEQTLQAHTSVVEDVLKWMSIARVFMVPSFFGVIAWTTARALRE